MADITQLVQLQRQYFLTGATRDVDARIHALKTLQNGLDKHEKVLLDALHQDLGKSRQEAYMTELGIIRGELDVALRHVRAWQRPKRVFTPLVHFPSSSHILYDPYGVCLVLSPWNYPAQLSLVPVIGAIAAGNCAILKPSNQSPATSQALEDLLEDCFDPRFVAVVQGGREQNQQLLHADVDMIFFTGSPMVGKLAMQAAAERLIPVVLELGGKSPCIVAKDADIALAARRIAWGKTVNAGQTCIAPDYILVHSSVKDQLVQQLQQALRGFWGDAPQSNPALGHIVNQHHYQRLLGLIKDQPGVIGGQSDAQTLRIAPTLLPQADWDSPAMQEEIFGPILPILAYDDLDDALAQITSRPSPLALYLFTQSKQVQRRVLGQVRFGGGCINDVLVHLANHRLPFGGVGQSGMGSYHGKDSFETFSRKKSVLKHATWLDVPLRYPPGLPMKWLKRLMKWMG